MPAPAPNILITIADDQRFDTVHALGNADIATPNLDAMVHGGTAFTRAYIMGSMVGAVCVPTRGMLHTGRTLFRAPDPLPEDAPLLGEQLRQAGYYTYGVGKWHNRRPTFARSFDGGARIFFGGMSDHDKVPLFDFDPTGEYPKEQCYIGDGFSTEMFTDAAADFLRHYDDERPFFLYVAYTAPHDPRTPPREFADLYPPERIPLPENFLPEHPFDNGEMRIRDEELAPWPRTPEIVRRHIADYYGMISHMDDGIGRVRQALEASGRAENTIVVHLADHGLAVGQHGLLGKQNLYDHSVRVPLLMRGPGIPQNTQIDALCHSFDLNATLLELAGIAPPTECEAKSLVPLLRGGRTAHRDTVFAAYVNVQRMVCDGRYKLIEYFVGDERTTQLFDLETDPKELHNLAGDPAFADRVAALREELARKQRELNDPMIEPR